jgi:hypothetical protein
VLLRRLANSKAKDPKPPVQCFSCSSKEEWGDLLIWGFWAHGMDVIVDVHMMDTDSKSYRSWDPHKVLTTQEREKKKKYLQSCLKHRRHFNPFVVWMDGLIG